MPRKEDKATAEKLNRLTQSIGPLTSSKEKSIKPNTKKTIPTFKTSEVVTILILTTIVCLFMGGVVVYNVIDKSNWKKVDTELQEFIQNYNYIIENYNGEVDQETLLDAALEGVLNKLDKNSVYLESEDNENFNIFLEGSYDGVGIQIYTDEENNIIVYSVFENSPADKAGLKAGDVITKLNGKSLEGVTTEELTQKLKKSQTEDIELTYVRDNKEKTITVKFDTVSIKSVGSKTYNKENKKIGYIAVSIFASNTYEQFETELTKIEKEKIDSLIIDLRANSGGYLSSSEKMISLFLDNDHVIYQIQKDKNTTKAYSKGKNTKKYKIIVLVDQNTASASEVMASALKEQYGATIVGKTTYGKGTVQELQTLANGDQYKLTTKNWLTSKGEWIDGKGIKPDVEVSLDDKYFEDPTEENDNQFQTALKEAIK